MISIKIDKFKFKILALGLLLIILISMIYFAYMYLTKPKVASITSTISSKVVVGNEIEVPIEIDTEGAVINAAEVHIKYDTSMVEVKSVSKDGSFFQLWIKDQPSFSNETGTLSFAGGLPTPGYSGKGKIGSATIKLLKPGKTELQFESKTRALLNDGKGTAIPLNLKPIEIRGTEDL